MGLFKNYRTDKNLETSGIVFTPDSTTAITLARAGGSNVKFSKTLEKRTKKFRRQIEAGTMDPKLDAKIMAEVFAETVVKAWETLVNDELVSGIEADPDAKDGTYTHEPDENGLVPFNRQNVVATLIALPDLFSDVRREAMAAGNFMDAEREDDAKN